MTTIVHSVEVFVSVRAAYEHWMSLEQFPCFMHGVREIRRLDERRQSWRVRLAGLGRVFEAAIVEQTPDRRIAWESLRGALHSGDVTFERLGEAVCRITVRIDYAPGGLVEILGSVLGVPSRAVREDLRRFASHVRAHAAAGGPDPVQLAWVAAAE